MAKSKGKSKPKLDFKDLLLRKGEYIALGLAGAGLVVLLLWGVTTGLSAGNPADDTKDLNAKASSITAKINDPTAEPVPPLPDQFVKSSKVTYPIVPVNEFAITGPLFDPVGRPDTKRENPQVLGIEEFQVHLVRAPMKAYDIIDSGDGPQIAVRVTQKKGEVDQTKVREALNTLKVKRQQFAQRKAPARPRGPGGPGQNNVLMSAPGGPGGPGGFGFHQDGSFDPSTARRSETAIEYVPLADLDKAVAAGKQPAMTVVPLRMAVVNATFPLKRQLEEIKRAMRFKDVAQASPYLYFDGFDVKRRVTSTGPDGKEVVVQDWADYDYQEKYVDLIRSRRLADYFEGADPVNNPDGAYLSYFYRYEDATVMPLPELVPELGKYPPVTLKSITEKIKELKAASAVPETPSTLLERLMKKGSRNSMFTPESATQTGGEGLFGRKEFSGPYFDPKSKGPGMPGKGIDPRNPDAAQAPPVEIDHMLVRFVDPDVRPGLTYSYQIRMKMLNPNYGEGAKYLANPRLGQDPYRVLEGKYVLLGQSLTIPTESYLFAADPAAYRAEMKELYAGTTAETQQRELYRRLQAKDDQAVVEAMAWLPEVRTDANGQREPVGAWVKADMPVGRGDYIGKQTFVKLPLWSSEQNQYVFRELPATRLVKGRDQTQPKGWLVDFASRSVLVDFAGGKVKTVTAAGRRIEEDAATELLIVQPNGKLVVRSSVADAADETRRQIATGWQGWLQAVEARPVGGTGPDGALNPFERKN